MTISNTFYDAYYYLRDDFYFTVSIYDNTLMKIFVPFNYPQNRTCIKYIHQTWFLD
jgi:hypothetical protein